MSTLLPSAEKRLVSPGWNIRSIVIPGTRCSASVTVRSGSALISTAATESTICSAFRLISCAVSMPRRWPVTMTSSGPAVCAEALDASAKLNTATEPLVPRAARTATEILATEFAKKGTSITTPICQWRSGEGQASALATLATLATLPQALVCLSHAIARYHFTPKALRLAVLNDTDSIFEFQSDSSDSSVGHY